jgi:hypothetical protein
MKAAATKRFVLDASVAVAWCFEDEATKFTESVLDLLSAGAEALVPAIWPVEVANALLIAERRKRIAWRRSRPCFKESPPCPSRSSPSMRPAPSTTSFPLRVNSLYPDTTPLTWTSPCGKASRWPRWMSNCAARRRPRASSCCRSEYGGEVAVFCNRLESW